MSESEQQPTIEDNKQPLHVKSADGAKMKSIVDANVKESIVTSAGKDVKVEKDIVKFKNGTKSEGESFDIKVEIPDSSFDHNDAVALNNISNELFNDCYSPGQLYIKVPSFDRLDELSSLEREIAKMHHIEPLAPSIAQRVNDSIGIDEDEQERVILDMQPPANNTNKNATKTIKNEDGSAIDVEIGSSTYTIDHEDLIAVLQGIDHTPKSETSGHQMETGLESSVTGEEVSDAVTIEGEGKFQVMDVIYDDNDEGEDEKPTTSAHTLMMRGQRPYGQGGSKLTPEQRAVAMEQIAGLKARADRQRRRKQDIKSLPVEATDLVSALSAEWSDDETHFVPPKNVNTLPETKIKKGERCIQFDRKYPVRRNNLTLPQYANNTVKPKTINETANAKSTNILPNAGFKRIIKRKIIWDPDAPETQISYAELVRNRADSLSKSPSTSSTVVPGVKKETTTKKRVQQPKEKSGPSPGPKSLDTTTGTAAAAAPRTQTPTSTIVTAIASVANSTASRRLSQTPINIAAGNVSGKRRKITEIDRLMGDEGAANMLNSLENELNQISDENGDKPHKPLRNRSLIDKKRATTPNLQKKDAPANTKSKRTPKAKAAMWDYVYKQQASDESMIIRRRSNSSYSSTSPRRLSLDGTATLKPKATSSSTKPATKSEFKSSTESSDGLEGEMFEFAKPVSKSTEKKNSKQVHMTVPFPTDMKTSVTPGMRTRCRSTTTPIFENKEVTVNYIGKVAHIIIDTQKAIFDCTFTNTLLANLAQTLEKLNTDKNCNAAVVTANRANFCQGIDFSELASHTADGRKDAAGILAKALKSYLKALGEFQKPLVVGVNGANIGLGVTQLALFDYVVAGERSTFETPYAKLGQLVEGFCICNRSLKIRDSFKMKLFFLCEKLPANEALVGGLINKVSHSAKVNDDAVAIAKKMATMSPETYRAMKSELMNIRWNPIKKALDQEFTTIIDQWTSSECYDKFKKYMDSRSS